MIHGTDIKTTTEPYMPVIRLTTSFRKVFEYPSPEASQCAESSGKTEDKQYLTHSKKIKKSHNTKQSQPSDKIFNFYVVIPINGLTLLYVKLRFTTQILYRAQNDSSAFANVITKQTFYKLRQNRDIEKFHQIENQTFSFYKLRTNRDIGKIHQIENITLSTPKMASAHLLSVDSEVLVPFESGSQTFSEQFLVFKSVEF